MAIAASAPVLPNQKKQCYKFARFTDAPCTIFVITIISALRVSGGFSARHQELIKLYVQP